MTSVMLGFGPKHHQEELMQKCLTYIYIYIYILKPCSNKYIAVACTTVELMAQT